MLLLICENFRKNERSKYRRTTPKNPVFFIFRRFKNAQLIFALFLCLAVF